jgi:adenosine deaminase
MKSEMTWYKQIPKIELHVHLEGAIPHDAMFDLIQKYGGDPSVSDVPALNDRFKCRDFSQFIETWSWKNQFLKEYEDFSYIAELTARDMASKNIRYAEMFFSTSLFVRHGLDVQNLTHAKHLTLAPCARTKRLTSCHGIACAFGTAISTPLVSDTIGRRT